MHSSCLMALNDRGCSPWLPPPPSLARAWGECFHWPMGLKRYKNLTWQTKGRHDQCTDSPRARLTEGTTLLQHPPPARDWHRGPFPTHGELAQGLSLTMRPTRTASPLCFFSPQWPETWLSPGFCAIFWPVWGMFSTIRLDVDEKCCLFQEGGHLGPNLPPPDPVSPHFTPLDSIQRHHLAGFMKTVPSDSWSPHTLNWLN